MSSGQNLFLTTLGFEDDPFAFTNADEESRLTDYFIPPPYFSTVFGDPDLPKSFVVFAPRGGGKSAQRIMIENKCKSDNVFSITYDQFEFPQVNKVSDISLHHHLQNIIRFMLIGILVEINSNQDNLKNINKNEKEIILKLSSEHLNSINDSSIDMTLNSLKGIKEKTKDFWNEWMPVIGNGIALIAKAILKLDVSFNGKFNSSETIKPKHLKYELRLLIDIIKKIGYRSVYILIDRVDESELTGNNAAASFKLVEPILKDLELLEFSGLGIKLFLWDQLEPGYLKIARLDRVRKETLEWNDDMLKQMWTRRLGAYSRGRISNLESISSLKSKYNIDELALIFANGSPRDNDRSTDYHRATTAQPLL